MSIQDKIARLRKRGKPRVLDLFAGCGGISLGFQIAGFDIIGAVEWDIDAAKTHAINFCKYDSSEMVELHSKSRDITKIEPSELIKELGYEEPCSEIVDVIVGGPPCQAFARVGRAKLREIASHPEAFLRDARSNLYLRYLEYVKQLEPLAILIENVPDVLNFGGHNIAHEICEVLHELGYVCNYTLLNSVYYGVPQMRERMFLIAYRKELNIKVVFPKPTNWVQLPIGYRNSRQVALKTIDFDLFTESRNYYVNPTTATKGLPKAITAEDALSDLPAITEHLHGNIKRGARRFTELVPYCNNNKDNEYAKLMKTWKGFSNLEGVSDHVIRILPRDFKIFAEMKPGDQYPEAFQAANLLFQRELEKLKISGNILKEKSKSYIELKKKYVPPYDIGKFPNKWRKMEPDMPARTLMAHLGKDSYSHIHYDSKQSRTISVREAARLQSFPDGFIFSGTMNPAFKQIGNSVPPLMAKAIADTMIQSINRSINVNVTENCYQEVNSI